MPLFERMTRSSHGTALVVADRVRELRVGEVGRLRTGIRSVMVAGMLAMLAATAAPAAGSPRAGEEPAASAPQVAVQRVSAPDSGLRDKAAMVLVGTALIGLAAAVRRAA